MPIAASTPIGALRDRITLQNPGPAVPDGDGGFTQTWSDLTPASVWAAIERASARSLERVAAGTVLSSATDLVTIRYHPQVTTQTRVLVNGRTLNVVSVQPIAQNWQQILVCTEVVQ